MSSQQTDQTAARSATDLAALSVAELEQQLGTSSAGLSQGELQERLARYGYNELAEEEANALLKFLGYFWGPIAWMIEIARSSRRSCVTGPISGSFSPCWA